MKLHWFDRVLLFVVACFVLACAALFALLPLGPVSAEAAVRIGNLPIDTTGQTLLWGGAAILLLLAVYLFATALHKRRKAPAPRGVTVRSGELGQVEITLQALDTLIQKCVRGFTAVKDCTSAMTVTDSGELNVQLKLALMPEANLPELSQQMQHDVKEYVQTNAGVTVRQITILVESTGTTPGRVQ